MMHNTSLCKYDIYIICMYVYIYIYIWPWVNTNYHQNWVGEHPHKEYSLHFWDVHQGYRVLTHTHIYQCLHLMDLCHLPLLIIFLRGQATAERSAAGRHRKTRLGMVCVCPKLGEIRYPLVMSK